MTSPIRPTDEQAKELARELLRDARYGALAVLDPQDGEPSVSRIAVGVDDTGWPYTLISDLSDHTVALRNHPVASLLVGEPEDRGDPLTHPRLSVRVMAAFIGRDSEQHAQVRSIWLHQHPKSKLYVDFGDFNFVRLKPQSAFLNGGFGKAYRLDPEDLLPPDQAPTGGA